MAYGTDLYRFNTDKSSQKLGHHVKIKRILARTSSLLRKLQMKVLNLMIKKHHSVFLSLNLIDTKDHSLHLVN